MSPEAKQALRALRDCGVVRVNRRRSPAFSDLWAGGLADIIIGGDAQFAHLRLTDAGLAEAERLFG